MSTSTWFIDERKDNEYLLAAVRIPNADLYRVRAEVKTFLLPGQRELHMRKETPARKKQAIALLAELQRRYDLEIRLFNAGRQGIQLDRRAKTIAELVRHVDAAAHLVFDNDSSISARDRSQLIQLSEVIGRAVTYDHQEPVHEILLGLPDVTAWAAGAKKPPWPPLFRQLQVTTHTL